MRGNPIRKKTEVRPLRPLDETNIRLLQHLQQDARISVAELARRLRRSEATIRERIQFLETHGVVRGYRADVDFEKLGIGATAIVRGAIDLREVPKLAKALAAVPNVVGADVVSGDRAIRIRVMARTIRELETVLQERIAPLGLHDIDTRVILESIVTNRPPDLEALAIEPRVALVPREDRPLVGASPPAGGLSSTSLPPRRP